MLADRAEEANRENRGFLWVQGGGLTVFGVGQAFQPDAPTATVHRVRLESLTCEKVPVPAQVAQPPQTDEAPQFRPPALQIYQS